MAAAFTQFGFLLFTKPPDNLTEKIKIMILPEVNT
jgi:hypothetical protein